jgi:hypothetical protein
VGLQRGCNPVERIPRGRRLPLKPRDMNSDDFAGIRQNQPGRKFTEDICEAKEGHGMSMGWNACAVCQHLIILYSKIQSKRLSTYAFTWAHSGTYDEFPKSTFCPSSSLNDIQTYIAVDQLQGN